MLSLRIASAKIQNDFENESIFPIFFEKTLKKGVDLDKKWWKAILGDIFNIDFEH